MVGESSRLICLGLICFLTIVEVQFSTKVDAVQTDGGGEFQALTSLFNTKGIAHRIACPHTLHQNGSVKCKRVSIMETKITLLTRPSLSLEFWDHACLDAYLVNRMPTANPDMKPPYFIIYQ